MAAPQGRGAQVSAGLPTPLRRGLSGAAYLEPGSEVVVFDCETTGTGREDRMVSLGAIRLTSTFEVAGVLHLVFNPGRPCNPFAAAVHGLSDRYLARQPRFAGHVQEIEAFLRGAALAAHNLAFDLRFLGAEFERAGLSAPALETARYCTMREWRRRHPNGESAKLDVALARLGLARTGDIHGALEDALLAAQVMRWLHHLPPRLHVPLRAPTNER